MNPRSLLNFLQTRSGKLLAFGLIFAAAMLLFSHTRNKSTSEDEPPVKPLSLDKITNQPQLVQTVQRVMEVFRPPPPKPEPKPLPVRDERRSRSHSTKARAGTTADTCYHQFICRQHTP